MNSDIKALLDSLRARVATNVGIAGLNLPSLARPSVRLATQRVPYGQLGIGQSRIGGIPDVPAGFEWPRWAPSRQREDKFGEPWHPEAATPLGLIAQIDLSVLPQVDEGLPGRGWLYFFYDRYCEPW